MVVLVTACAAPSPAPEPRAPSPALLRVESPPEWRPGDTWLYQWRSGAADGSKPIEVEVLELRELKGTKYYVQRVEGGHQYYTLDLHWAFTVRNGVVEARVAPAEPWFVWPLEVGRRWTHHGTYEDRDGKREADERFAVVAAEAVDVPAGRFQALKIVRETDTRFSDEYWYAPEVKSYVKWIGRRGDEQFEWQLSEYRPAPRLITPANR